MSIVYDYPSYDIGGWWNRTPIHYSALITTLAFHFTESKWQSRLITYKTLSSEPSCVSHPLPLLTHWSPKLLAFLRLLKPTRQALTSISAYTPIHQHGWLLKLLGDFAQIPSFQWALPWSSYLMLQRILPHSFSTPMFPIVLTTCIFCNIYINAFLPCGLFLLPEPQLYKVRNLSSSTELAFVYGKKE